MITSSLCSSPILGHFPYVSHLCLVVSPPSRAYIPGLAASLLLPVCLVVLVSSGPTFIVWVFPCLLFLVSWVWGFCLLVLYLCCELCLPVFLHLALIKTPSAAFHVLLQHCSHCWIAMIATVVMLSCNARPIKSFHTSTDTRIKLQSLLSGQIATGLKVLMRGKRHPLTGFKLKPLQPYLNPYFD